MASLTLATEDWARQQFETCELGDQRRNKRIVKFAAQMAASPDGSTPNQTEKWADCKAAYRLFKQPTVTFDAVTAPHHELTRQTIARGKWLVLNDTTEINFGYDRQLEAVGRVGKFGARGFYLHSALAVAVDGQQIIGLAAQELYSRPLRKLAKVSSRRRKLSRRETEVWSRVIDRVGMPGEDAELIHVCDRGADDFDVYCHLVAQRAGWIIRAAQLTRCVFDEDGVSQSLDQLIRSREVVGRYELQVAANKKQPARAASLEVRIARLFMPWPKTGVSRYAKASGLKQIPMWAVEVREPNPPRGAKALRWVLLTSEPLRNFDDAWRVIGWYENRPIVEEYHKCAKTGCRVEERLYHSGDRLAPVIGMLSVLAVRLLQLKVVARTNPERPAREVVPKSWLRLLPRISKSRQPIRTVRDFFRRLAGLGGFLGRKSDGEPGWQTIWHGLEKLLIALRGARAARRRSG